MSQLTTFREFPSCGIGRGSPGQARWTPQGEEMQMSVQGGQGDQAARVYRQSTRPETVTPRENAGDLEEVPSSIQQRSHPYTHANLLPNAQGRNNLMGSGKSTRHSHRAKNIACSYSQPGGKKSDFSGHWSEYS